MRMPQIVRTSRVSGSFFAVLLFGCAPLQPIVHRSVAGTSFEARPLPMEAFEFQEIRERGDVLSLETQRSAVLIDINSTVRVRPKIDLLGKVAAPTQPLAVDARAEEELATAREMLIRTLEQTRKLLLVWARVEELYPQTHDAGGQRITADAVKPLLDEFDAKKRERTAVAIQIRKAVMDYVEVSRKEEVAAIRRQFEQRLLTAGEQLSEDEIRRGTLNGWLETNVGAVPFSKGFSEFLEKEIAARGGEARKRHDRIVEAAGVYKLRLRATLKSTDGAEVPLHLAGYDRLDAGEYVHVERFTLKLDEKDQKRLKAEVDFYASLAKSINEIRDANSPLREALKKKFDETASELKKAFEKIDLASFEAASQEGLAKLRGLVKGVLGEEASKELVKDIQALEEEARKIIRNLEALQNLANKKDLKESELLVDLIYGGVGDLLQSFVGLLSLLDPNPPGGTDSLLTRFQKVIKKINDTPALSTAAIRAVVDQLTAPFMAMASTTEGMKSLASLAQSFAAYLEHSGAKNAAGLSPDPGIEGKILDIPFNQVTDTEIPVTSAARRDGDTIVFVVQILDKNGSVVAEGTKVFRVYRFGFYADPSAGVIFVNRINTPAGGREVEFVAAPAVSYGVRFRTRGEGVWARAWNATNLAVGLHAGLLNFEGSDVEVGVGGVVSLFGDLVSTGYGYNLQVGEDRDYWFIGIGLLELLEAVRGKPIF